MVRRPLMQSLVKLPIGSRDNVTPHTFFFSVWCQRCRTLGFMVYYFMWPIPVRRMTKVFFLTGQLSKWSTFPDPFVFNC